MQLSAGMFLQLPKVGIPGGGNENYFRSTDNSKNSNKRSVCVLQAGTVQVASSSLEHLLTF